MVSTLVISMLSSIKACSNAGPNETGGNILGGVGGALIGSQFGRGTGQLIGVAVGALVGSQLGGYLGHQLDERDKALAQQTLHNSLESAPDGRVNSWKNPNTSHSGQIRVNNTVTQGANVCRDYTHMVMIDNKQEQVKGRACRNSNGEWIVQR